MPKHFFITLICGLIVLAALTDKFWLYLLTWHIGLFLTLFLGQIGVQGKGAG
jgi:photosystem I protein PsaO